MVEIETLLAYEEIRALVARRVRCLDEKDWAGFAACYAPDAKVYSFVSSDAPEDVVVGAQNIADRVATALQHRKTVHQVHTPELALVDDERATGIWPLQDLLFWERDGQRHWIRGFGHYRQTYRKLEGRWLIQEHRLTRLHLERGTEPL